MGRAANQNVNDSCEFTVTGSYLIDLARHRGSEPAVHIIRSVIVGAPILIVIVSLDDDFWADGFIPLALESLFPRAVESQVLVSIEREIGGQHGLGHPECHAVGRGSATQAAHSHAR